MNVRPLGRTVALAVTVVLAATACSGSDDPKASGGPEKVTVWIMKDSVTDAFLDRFRTGFEAEHRGIDLDIQIQEWDGIGEKVTAALASKDAPDVIEVGNTQVAQYAASGGVRDLSDKVAALNGADWLPGLAEPGKVDGKQYGIPWYGASRVVIYHKDLFAAAGVTPPKTQEEWLATTARLNKGKTQGIYLPGQNWYTLSGFVWEAGGDLAVQDGGKWKGALDTPQALAGMDFYRRLQALGKGPKDADESKPPQAEVRQGRRRPDHRRPRRREDRRGDQPRPQGQARLLPLPGRTAGKPGAVHRRLRLHRPRGLHPPRRRLRGGRGAGRREVADGHGQDHELRPQPHLLARVVQDDEGTAVMAAGAAQAGRPPTPRSGRPSRPPTRSSST